MKQLRFWGFLPAFCLLSLPLLAQPNYELRVGTGTGNLGNTASVPLELDTDADIQGLQIIGEWEEVNGIADTLDVGAAVTDANTIAMRLDADDGDDLNASGMQFFALGIVMDNDGVGGEVIEAGNNLDIGTLNITCAMNEGTFPIALVDQAYAMVGTEPLLDNIVVEGGLSIGATEDLILTDGSFTCQRQPDELVVEDGSNPPLNSPDAGDPCGDVRILMTNGAPVEGYVIAVCHDPAHVDLESIAVGSAAVLNGADFEAPEITPGVGGTLGVVLDLFSPFEGNVIPIGEGQEIAVLEYCCDRLPPPEADPTTSIVQFCDNTLGSPLKENVIVVGGLSRGESDGLILTEGTFTCNPGEAPPPPTEICDNGEDDNEDGLTDLDDPDCQQAFMCEDVEASINETFPLCFYIKSPEDNAVGHAQEDHIQGFSMAVSYCCDIEAVPNEDGVLFDISGTIVEAIGAEFVTAQADNDPEEVDGDGCELIIGVLVNALPPFDGATIPPLDDFQKVGCVLFTVKKDATCGACCPIEFTDKLDGTGNVPVKNLISVENRSKTPALLVPCEVCIRGEEHFYRGDCNFSREAMQAVDIADAAAVISFLFLTGEWKYEPKCLDACDCNDDGRIDLADALCILKFYLQKGPFPLAPGPGIEKVDGGIEGRPEGPDPTDDKLGCEDGDDCLNGQNDV